MSDPNWVNAMHDKLESFERNQIWVLEPTPSNCHPIGTKWVFKNKESDDGALRALYFSRQLLLLF